MAFILKHKDKLLLAGILVLATILIFFRLDRADMLTDDSLYAFRSLGYLDFLDSQFQPTPIQWFDSLPFWSKLSFHDAPPLVFIIQFIFFKIFFESVLVSRLPFALAGLGSVILLYLIIKKLSDKNTALFSALILSVLNFHLWTSRTGYLEAVMVFFSLITLYYFLKGFDKDKYFLIFGLFLGLTFLTKYSAFFLVPFTILYILFKDRKIFFNKKFILGILIALILFSPVIIYNFKMYQARGHFDLQFSQLFNQAKAWEDWPKFKHEGGKDYFANFTSSITSLKNIMSLPFFILFIISLLFLLGDFLKNLFFKIKISEDKKLFWLIYFFSLILIFAFIGTSIRFLPPFNPLIAASIAIFLVVLGRGLKKFFGEQKIGFNLFWFLIILIILFEAFYTINTNLLYQPLGKVSKFYSSYRFDNLGYNQLEKYIFSEIKEKSYFIFKPRKISRFADLHSTFLNVSGKDFFIFDPNLYWFAVLWYFRRMPIYHNLPMASGEDLALVLPDVNWFDYFQAQDVKNLYFIKNANPSVLGDSEKTEINLKNVEMLAGLFVLRGAKVIEIKNPRDEVTFRIYKLKLN